MTLLFECRKEIRSVYHSIERRGYAIKREVAAWTGGKLKLGPSVLYESIRKMLEAGVD
jgi:DNA-binding PadR family transcriptional regulator